VAVKIRLMKSRGGAVSEKQFYHKHITPVTDKIIPQFSGLHILRPKQ
jgi:hypothetical protein